jgi:anthranilate synthase component 2
MILLVDNYDSFTFNLYQMIGALDPNIKVVRNDELSLEQIEELAPSHIVLSPGPGRPEHAGICMEAVRHFAGKTPLLGVCLGHQSICAAFGATITYAKTLMHGKASTMRLDTATTLFAGLPSSIQGARYHSLAAEPGSLPCELIPTSVTDDGEIMAVQHREFPVFGVQFHPESILTPLGSVLVANFLNERNHHD